MATSPNTGHVAGLWPRPTQGSSEAGVSQTAPRLTFQPTRASHSTLIADLTLSVLRGCWGGGGWRPSEARNYWATPCILGGPIRPSHLRSSICVSRKSSTSSPLALPRSYLTRGLRQSGTPRRTHDPQTQLYRPPLTPPAGLTSSPCGARLCPRRRTHQVHHLPLPQQRLLLPLGGLGGARQRPQLQQQEQQEAEEPLRDGGGGAVGAHGARRPREARSGRRSRRRRGAGT